MEFLKYLLLITGIAGIASAHPPSSIDLQFDEEQQILTVIMNHSVNNSNKHYINKVSVKLNKQPIIEQKFTRQFDNKQQMAIYRIIDAKSGDTVEVTAFCNLSGKMKQEIIVGEKKE